MQPSTKNTWGSYSLEGAGLQNAAVLQRVEWFTEKDVASDRTRKNPRLLGSVSQLTSDLHNTSCVTQLTQYSTEERRL